MVLFGKVKRVLCSVKSAIAILVCFAVLSAIGTLVPQGPLPHEAETSSTLHAVLNTLQIYNIFHSFWFAALTVLLALNLIFCTWFRLLAKPAAGQSDRSVNGDRLAFPAGNTAASFNLSTCYTDETTRIAGLMSGRFRRLIRSARENETVFRGEKGLLSIYGVYLIHASILLILLGAVLDAFFSTKGSMQIAEGTTENLLYLDGDPGVRKLDFAVRCDRFTLTLYDTGAPKMYRSDLTFLKDERPVQQSAIRVNHPTTFGGLRFYQASYGEIPVAAVRYTRLPGGGKSEALHTTTGQLYPLPGDDAAFEVIRMEENFMNMGPAAKLRVHSPQREMQFWIFQHIDTLRQTYPDVFDSMPVLNPASFAPYVFTLDGTQSRYYTGLQVMREPGAFWVGLGAALMIMGFITVFFCPQRQVWVAVNKTERGTAIRIAGLSRRDPAGLQKQIADIKTDIKNKGV